MKLEVGSHTFFKKFPLEKNLMGVSKVPHNKMCMFVFVCVCFFFQFCDNAQVVIIHNSI